MAPSAAHLAIAAVALVLLGAGEAPSRTGETEGGSSHAARELARAASVASVAAPPEAESPTLPLPAPFAQVPTLPLPAPPAPRPEPSFEDVPWSTGLDIGTGVAMKDTQNPRGESAFIGYAGYNVSLADAEAWVAALYGAWLRDRGVRYVWAVRGPDDSHYENKELGNTKIGAKLRAIARAASFILVAAHSSGSCVAHELFKQLAEGRDPEGATAGKIVYFNLDGIEKGLTPGSVSRLRRAYFVGAVDGATRTASPNDVDMRRLAKAYAGSGGYLEYDGRDAGCADGASWCLHVTLVTDRPHDPRAASAHLDYTEFSRGDVATGFFEMKAKEAGLGAP